MVDEKAVYEELEAVLRPEILEYLLGGLVSKRERLERQEPKDVADKVDFLEDAEETLRGRIDERLQEVIEFRAQELTEILREAYEVAPLREDWRETLELARRELESDAREMFREERPGW